MTRYSPDLHVLGAAVLSILGTTRFSELQPYFHRYGIYNYDPDVYYPIGPLVEMVDDLVRDRQRIDSAFDLFSLGVANGRSIPVTPELDSLDKVLLSWPGVHTQIYRGADIGYVRCEQLDVQDFVLHFRWPWSDGLAYGTIYGMCLRFLPPNTKFAVYYDEDAPRADFGADETVIHVEWQ
ncbi:hypothetical protein [Aggregatilinea lenta]|uniref:hypothetical protein n=1 Tax=Aggregatilinea lenta TaxID=913108 RepID=UPI000E5AB13E|nr:hypothetical protein [Aggregatilinea lenta]